MTERTGGHYRDTGAGPKPLSLLSGNAQEGSAQEAYRAYMDHRPRCADCREGTTFHCPAASDLWDIYKALRV